jgi:hypothetical protein
MAVINVPDPALTHTFVVRIQVSEAAPSVSVMLPDSSGLWPASFGPEEFTGPEQTANQAALALLVAKAKARWEAAAAAHTDESGAPDPNTINWVAP